MAEGKEPEVMTAADMKRRVQAGEDPSESRDGGQADNSGNDSVTITGEDMMERGNKPDAGGSSVDDGATEKGADANGGFTESADAADGASNSGADAAAGGADAGKQSESTENTDADDGGAESAPEDEKSGRKSKKKKREKKDPRDEKIAELNDKLLRNLAEFENFRNRSEKEKEARFDMGARSVVEKILPVVDNLERGLGGLADEEKETPFAKGIEAVYKQLMSAFSEMGVAPIEAVGQEFDPNLHQAVMHEEDDSDETNKVVEELQKGYMYKDTVVRYSMVKVLN